VIKEWKEKMLNLEIHTIKINFVSATVPFFPHDGFAIIAVPAFLLNYIID